MPDHEQESLSIDDSQKPDIESAEPANTRIPEDVLVQIAASGDRRMISTERSEQERIDREGRRISARENETGRIPDQDERKEMEVGSGRQKQFPLRLGSWGKEIGRFIKSDADLNLERKLRDTKSTVEGQRAMARLNESQRAAYKRGVDRARHVLDNPHEQSI